MKKIGNYIGIFLLVVMYFIQIYGYYVLFGPIAAVIAFLVPISLFGYPFFFHSMLGFWPTGWIIWFVVGIILVSVTSEKKEEMSKYSKQINPEGYCPKCGGERKLGNSFCPDCGYKFNDFQG